MTYLCLSGNCGIVLLSNKDSALEAMTESGSKPRLLREPRAGGGARDAARAFLAWSGSRTSHHAKATPVFEAPALEGNERAEVAVIGAGITSLPTFSLVRETNLPLPRASGATSIETNVLYAVAAKKSAPERTAIVGQVG